MAWAFLQLRTVRTTSIVLPLGSSAHSTHFLALLEATFGEGFSKAHYCGSQRGDSSLRWAMPHYRVPLGRGMTMCTPGYVAQIAYLTRRSHSGRVPLGVTTLQTARMGFFTEEASHVILSPQFEDPYARGTLPHPALNAHRISTASP